MGAHVLVRTNAYQKVMVSPIRDIFFDFVPFCLDVRNLVLGMRFEKRIFIVAVRDGRSFGYLSFFRR